MISHRKYYFPLTVDLIERDDYGGLDYGSGGNEYDGKYQRGDTGIFTRKWV